jgi:VWFA-related protein
MTDAGVWPGLVLLISLGASAQEPARQPAGPTQQTPTTLSVTTTNVLVPTLVENGKGEVVYELKADNFSLTDNGVPQKLHLDADLDTTPVSLVVCLERGRSSELQFEKFARLAPLVEQFLGTGNGEVALVEFDSQAVYREGFTRDTGVIEQDLEQLEPGDGGAAILDAVGTSLQILEQRPSERRRILLLISESRDHGSKTVTAPQLVEQIGASNTLVLSLTWSPAKAEVLDQLAHGGGNLIEFLPMAVQAMRSNVARSLAVMSGGEYLSFTGQKSFEDRISEMAGHARNRYILSFRPTDASPGLHRLDVKLNAGVDGHLVARTGYWATAPSTTNNP